jgi:proteasome lid subunit RPN8/RPN11
MVNKIKKTWAIKKKVLMSIMEFSKRACPNEFAAMLVSDSYVIDDIYVYPLSKNYTNSVIINPLATPITPRIVGSVHSHPRGFGAPSTADLFFFKGKKINLIVFFPFALDCFIAYNRHGEKINIDVV